MSPKKVALVGHSNLPKYIEHTDRVNYRIFRSPGASIQTVRDSLVFDHFWKVYFDATVVVIGGNDIGLKAPAQIIEDLKSLYSDIIEKDGLLIPCTIEYRNYAEGNAFIDSKDYITQERAINRSLKRYFRREEIAYIDLSRNKFPNERTPDGVHFTDEVIEHFKTIINDKVHKSLF